MEKARIIKHLKKDKVLAPIITEADFPEVTINENLYASLIEAIISQQLSVSAARTIYTRFLALFNNKIPSGKTLCRADNELLRTAGVSNQKAGYLKNIALFEQENSLDYHDLKHLDDEGLILYLTQIKGVGRWTSEMILMFNLNRLNILPLDDLGIQNAMKKLYKLDGEGRTLKSSMLACAAPWDPYKTIACKYLWRWKDRRG